MALLPELVPPAAAFGAPLAVHTGGSTSDIFRVATRTGPAFGTARVERVSEDSRVGSRSIAK